MKKIPSSNRTFMELKYYSNTTEYKNIDRSNRTFMELKSLLRL